MREQTITIFGEKIPVSHEEMPIDKLKYFEENPRVFSCVFGEDKPENDDELQAFIQKNMWLQQSVKNLIPTIREHDGLLDPILIRHDTYEVIEGNSRLAAFRYLNEKAEEEAKNSEKPKDEKWTKIPCNVVSKLTDEQQDAYLSQIHIKGKTAWSAYEKANFAYIRSEGGVSSEEIAHRSSETVGEINKRIITVDLMKKNDDKVQEHFSYYNELVRSRNINQAGNYTPDVKDFLLSKIKNMGVEDSGDGFTAQHLRDRLPVILRKKKELKKFMEGRSNLDQAYQNSRPSDPRQKVKIAKDKIVDINKTEIDRLEKQEIDALLADINKLSKAVKRVQSMVEKVKEENQQNAQ